MFCDKIAHRVAYLGKFNYGGIYMCDICNSLFGHLSSCPESSEGSSTYCLWCENRLNPGEEIVTFPSGSVLCRDCVNDFDLSDLCAYLDVDSVFELIEKYGICEIERII